MQAPFFFLENITSEKGLISLSEETSKHIVQVLRMKNGETLLLTDGKGNLLTCEISEGHKKKCVVRIKEKNFKERPSKKVSIAISLLKNANRFEWFLEKSTELGVNEIIPLICVRTEKQHFRTDRMKNIMVSALLQSQQVWLPDLKMPMPLKDLIAQSRQSQKFIAHCVEEAKVGLAEAKDASAEAQIILIGPEGDFTKEEIDLAARYHFVPVSLGGSRLRTETAGIVAAALLTI